MTDSRDGALLADVQALAQLGVWDWNVTRNELVWSAELYRILDIAPEVAASFEAWLARVHPDDQTTVKSYLSRARRELGSAGIEYRVLRSTGEIRTLQARVRSRTEADGSVRLIGTEQDITEYKAVLARVVFSDRMVSIGTLAGGVAHEINNPLAAIATNLTLLAEARRDPLIAEAQQGVERIRMIVRGLTAFSRVDDEPRHAIDVQRVLELAIALVGNELRHRARLVTKFGALPAVIANEARLGHVFLSLLTNAAESIPEGKANGHEVRVESRTDAAGWAIVEFHDTGVGIPRDVQPRIFDPFFTTKPVGQGTGLGLSICHGILRSLGGDITFTSEPGKGSTFVVALPPTATPVAPAAPVPITRSARGSILIVDDDVLFANSMKRLLSADHAITVANSGRAALDRVHAGERFDVILCDLMMPEMTGPELYAELQRVTPEQARRMIFMTGGAFTPAAQSFLERITNPWFEKPCDLQELRTAIASMIEAR